MEKNLAIILKNTELESNGCLIWTKCFNTDGYPRALIEGNANAKVHRVVCELHTGQDISGLVVRHTCDNIKCVNPEHLIIGTYLDNVNDRVIRDRSQGLKKDKVIAIKYLYHKNLLSVKELANLFSCSEQTIYYSLNKRK